MSNNINNPRKNKSKVNTAHYLISRFLSSPHSLKFKLSGNAQSLLRHLGDLMDAKLSKYKTIESRKCEVTITKLCKQAGMTDKPAKRFMDQLLKQQLIELVKKLPKNKAIYKLGNIFSVWENLRNCEQVSIGDLAVSIGDLENSSGETPILIYNNTSNNTNNNDFENPKTEKQEYKQAKASPLLEEFCSKNNLIH